MIDVRRPLLLDAAMGTRLLARGLDLGCDDPALWNLTHPDQVFSIHHSDVVAGSDALLTNTFGANRPWLERVGFSRRTAEINRTAVRLAQQAAGPDRMILGSIGPTALRSAKDFREQAESLVEAGAQTIFLETISIRRATLDALRACLATCRLPIIISGFDWPPGAETGQFALELLALGATGLGYNCTPHLEAISDWVTRMRQLTEAPLVIKPSVRRPINSGTYPEWTRHLVAMFGTLNGLMLGGCCGSTERDIAAMRHVLDARR